MTAVVITCAASWAPATWAACDIGLVITFQSDILLCREWWWLVELCPVTVLTADCGWLGAAPL